MAVWRRRLNEPRSIHLDQGSNTTAETGRNSVRSITWPQAWAVEGTVGIMLLLTLF